MESTLEVSKTEAKHQGVEIKSSAPAIHVENLHKSFGSSHVLNGVNLGVRQGEIYALMGPNGSGKSTLAAIIASVVIPDSAKFEIFGAKPSDSRKFF